MKQFGPKNSMDTALHASHGRVLWTSFHWWRAFFEHVRTQSGLNFAQASKILNCARHGIKQSTSTNMW
jgi:hypothetical protein